MDGDQGRVVLTQGIGGCWENHVEFLPCTPDQQRLRRYHRKHWHYSFFYLWLIWHQVSLCSPGWPWTHSSWQSSYLSLLSGGITHAYASHIVFLQNYSFSDCGRKMLEYQNLGNINEHKEQYALSPGTMSKAFSGYLRLTSHMFTTSPYVCIWVIKLYKRGTIRGRQS